MTSASGQINVMNGGSGNLEEILQKLKKAQVYDFLRVNVNNDFKKFIATQSSSSLSSPSSSHPQGLNLNSPNHHNQETVHFSDLVTKINRKGKHQERALVVTSSAIYNFDVNKYSKFKRKILITQLRGIVLSRSSDEFALQVSDSYDYRYIIHHRVELIEKLNFVYEAANSKPLQVTFTEQKELIHLIVTKDMMKKHKSSNFSNGMNSINQNHSLIHSNSNSNIAETPKLVTEGFRVLGSFREGWLNKKKGKSDKWDRKYFVLTDDSLSYYAPRIKGNLQIVGAFEVQPAAPNNVYSGDPNNFSKINPGATSSLSSSYDLPLPSLPPNAAPFRVKADKRKQPLELAAENSSDRAKWISAFSCRSSEAGVDINKQTHIEGWLMKQDGTGDKSWRRLYFVLVRDRCWYFEMALKGRIDLLTGVSAHATTTIQPTEDSDHNNFTGEIARSRYAYRWNVSDHERIFYIASDSEDDMNQWILSVERLSRQHTRGASLVDEGRSKLPNQFIESIEQQAPENQVTFVFTDVQNSTNLWENVPDAMDVALEQHDRILRELLKKYNGYEVKTEGDAFMVTFFTVQDAVLWCMETQVRLLEADWSLEFSSQPSARREVIIDPRTKNEKMIWNGIRIRMGIHTGFPNCRRNPVTGRMDYFGPVVNRSARVSDTAHGGQVVCTQEVLEELNSNMTNDSRFTSALIPIITDFGFHNLKGVPDAVKIIQLMPTLLAQRILPPIRTVNNEKKEKEKALLNGSTEDGSEDEEESSVTKGSSVSISNNIIIDEELDFHSTVASTSLTTANSNSGIVGPGSFSQSSIMSPHNHNMNANNSNNPMASPTGSCNRSSLPLDLSISTPRKSNAPAPPPPPVTVYSAPAAATSFIPSPKPFNLPTSSPPRTNIASPQIATPPPLNNAGSGSVSLSGVVNNNPGPGPLTPLSSPPPLPNNNNLPGSNFNYSPSSLSPSNRNHGTSISRLPPPLPGNSGAPGPPGTASPSSLPYPSNSNLGLTPPSTTITPPPILPSPRHTVKIHGAKSNLSVSNININEKVI